jgi:hypothetical protein
MITLYTFELPLTARSPRSQPLLTARIACKHCRGRAVQLSQRSKLSAFVTGRMCVNFVLLERLSSDYGNCIARVSSLMSLAIGSVHVSIISSGSALSRLRRHYWPRCVCRVAWARRSRSGNFFRGIKLKACGISRGADDVRFSGYLLAIADDALHR